MTVIRAQDAPSFPRAGLAVTGLAAPSRGAHETCLYRISVGPGTEAPAHILDREEIFFVLSGAAVATLGAEPHTIHPGDALVVPPGVVFRLAALGDRPFEAVGVMPSGGRARLVDGDGAPFSPPWTV